jgi:hypothetical protein
LIKTRLVASPARCEELQVLAKEVIDQAPGLMEQVKELLGGK